MIKLKDTLDQQTACYVGLVEFRDKRQNELDILEARIEELQYQVVGSASYMLPENDEEVQLHEAHQFLARELPARLELAQHGTYLDRPAAFDGTGRRYTQTD